MPLETVAGAGYIALDILLASKHDRQVRRSAGGTCGNVLAILSFLGHASVPIARLGTDKAADLIISDLKSTGVDCRHVQRDPSGRTPRVVELLPDQPGSTHRFVFSVSLCVSVAFLGGPSRSMSKAPSRSIKSSLRCFSLTGQGLRRSSLRWRLARVAHWSCLNLIHSVVMATSTRHCS